MLSKPADGAEILLTASASVGFDGETPDALRTLGEYLELSLDMGARLIVFRPHAQSCAVYVDAADGENNIQSCGTMKKTLAEKILRLTHAGVNHLEIDGRPYRFVRSFTNIARHGAVVFAPT